jgi:hypothetical protein
MCSYPKYMCKSSSEPNYPFPQAETKEDCISVLNQVEVEATFELIDKMTVAWSRWTRQKHKVDWYQSQQVSVQLAKDKRCQGLINFGYLKYFRQLLLDEL